MVGPEKLQLRESPDPSPAGGEIRIRVKASGINFADILARQGLYPDSPKIPCVVGYEVSGTVDTKRDSRPALSKASSFLCVRILRQCP
jgi:NADPH:quinone reductase and related Zn-dependent oxidoreductases